MLEKELEEKLRKRVANMGGRAYKFVSPGNTGVPDRLIILPGGHVGFIELKQQGKKPTPNQRRQIVRLRALGCVACVVDTEEGIQSAIDYILLDGGEQ